MTHQPEKALFLDRDGVINVNHGYVFNQQMFEWIPGIFELVKQAKQQAYLVIVVTNQSGIGRGYYSEQDFQQLTQWMLSEFDKQGCSLTDIYYCPHHPKDALGIYKQQCDCRKPAPGMINQAVAQYSLNPEHCVMVGDKAGDMQAAFSAQIGRRILFSEDKSQQSKFQTEQVTSLAQIHF
ncbi:D-glycero-beta-D-manno-heptose 1,7-bisphosphate 7-phosphatase [Glaciecola sp. 1036]|uniref:D-glycero-beta-D-manno-heptose 1,7-bisphosphate 7-phosphatase n=1 Tax=Alteromonadaceae TaxID=72275 RepID=UPI003D06E05D